MKALKEKVFEQVSSDVFNIIKDNSPSKAQDLLREIDVVNVGVKQLAEIYKVLHTERSAKSYFDSIHLGQDGIYLRLEIDKTVDRSVARFIFSHWLQWYKKGGIK